VSDSWGWRPHAKAGIAGLLPSREQSPLHRRDGRPGGQRAQSVWGGSRPPQEIARAVGRALEVGLGWAVGQPKESADGQQPLAGYEQVAEHDADHDHGQYGAAEDERRP
jgi:hypothetical protein